MVNTIRPCTLTFPSTCSCSSSYRQATRCPSPSSNTIPPLPIFLSLLAPYPMAPVVAQSLPSPIQALPNALSILSHRTLPNPNFFLRPPLQKPSRPPLSPRPIDPTSRAINGAYATFISKDDYLPCALVLAYCHHMTRSIYPFIILATSVAASRGLAESLAVSLPKWADSSA